MLLRSQKGEKKSIFTLQALPSVKPSRESQKMGLTSPAEVAYLEREREGVGEKYFWCEIKSLNCY